MITEQDVAGSRFDIVTGGLAAIGNYAVIGHPVGHSRSPELHSAWFKAAARRGMYSKVDIAPHELVHRGPSLPFEFSGLNVTVPHKVAILGYVDRVDATAEAAGAANLLYRDADKAWTAGNTDGDGFLLAIEEATGEGALGRDVAILGAGGAARAIGRTLRKEGASVTWINRTLSTARKLGPAASLHRRVLHDLDVSVDLLINTLPPGVDLGSFDLSPLPDHAVVTDINYYDEQPQLLERAAARRLFTQDGRGMFLWQAALSFERWTGLAPDMGLGMDLLGMD
jgi:shikimate dehydrogenase